MNISLRTFDQLLSIFVLLTFGILSGGCAATNSRIQKTEDPLQSNEIDLSQPILVQPIETDDMKFLGDESDNPNKTNREREIIHDRLDDKIRAALSKKGFQTRSKSKTSENEIIIDGEVTGYHRGTEYATGQLTPGGRWQRTPVMRMVVSIKSGSNQNEVANFVVRGRYVGEYYGEETILKETMNVLAEQLASHLSEQR